MLRRLITGEYNFRIGFRLGTAAVRGGLGGHVLLCGRLCDVTSRRRLFDDRRWRANHRGGNRRCRWHKHSEQEQKPKTDEFHKAMQRSYCIAPNHGC